MLRARILLVVGLAALSIHCSASSSDEAPTANGADNEVIAKVDGRLELVCNVGGGKIVEVHPSWGELHRIDLNAGTWSMDDGLTMKATGSTLTITDDEGGAVATIENHVYKEGATKGPCDDFVVKDLKTTSAPFTLDDALEYHCEIAGGRELVIRPKFGEIDEIDANKGTFLARDGMTFTTKSLESQPAPKNQISGVDDEGGAVGALLEDDKGVTWSNGKETGTCKKTQRSRVKR